MDEQFNNDPVNGNGQDTAPTPQDYSADQTTNAGNYGNQQNAGENYGNGSYQNQQGYQTGYGNGGYQNQQGYQNQYQQNNQYGYGGPNNYQPTYSNEPTGEKDGVATAILVLGILSIICCAPCGIVSLVLRANNKHLISPEKQSYVTAGYITSIIGLVICGVGILANVVIIALGGTAALLGGGY